ncbi:MAG: class I SAM-dependent methyltransferase [Gammaproteobacteria bacterium]
MARSLATRPDVLLALALALVAPRLLAQHAHGDHAGDAGGGHGHAVHANQYMNQSAFEDLAARFESAERDAWQKPDAVMARLGELAGKRVLDIGSGTGYFSFRLAAAGAHVICADVDERFLGYIRERMSREQVDPAKMELRQLAFDSPGLAPAEVDLVMLVDTYHHIENRETYFAAVRAGLASGGRLVVIDFFKRDDPVGPPPRMKVAEDEVVAELARAGFSRFTIERGLLPYQYLVEAWP